MSALVHLLLFQMFAYIPVYFTITHPITTPKKVAARVQNLQNRCLCAVLLYCEVNIVFIMFFSGWLQCIFFFSIYVRKPIQQMQTIAVQYSFSSSVSQGCRIASSQFVDTGMDYTVISRANDSPWEFHQKVWHCPEQYISLKHIL